jgi:hypothetical protein
MGGARRLGAGRAQTSSGACSLEGEQPNLEIVRVHRLREVLLVGAGAAQPGEEAREGVQ